MNTTQIQRSIMQQIEIHSGLDQHRDYFGISKIGDCPHHAVMEYLHGVACTEEAHRMCFAGYEHEMSIMELLVLAGIVTVQGLEVVAPFDSRFRGHIDALTCDDDLLEIKSVSTQKFQQVMESGKPLKKHVMQVQLYMRYGGWHQTFVVYRCRETYQHMVIRAPYIQSAAEHYEEKAKKILHCIDNNQIPDCECRRCK